ncbi:hypothetical protein FOL47_005073, partial [Perkinsus chesapeaki]
FAHSEPDGEHPKQHEASKQEPLTRSQASPVTTSSGTDESASPETVEITQRLLRIIDDDPRDGSCVVSRREKLAGPMINIPVDEAKVLPALLDTGAYYNYISASLVDKLGLSSSSRGVSESLRVTLADGSIRQVVAVVDVSNIQFRVIQGGRSSNAILGVRSMCDCGVTLSFGTTGDNERSVKVKGELKQLTSTSSTAATVGDPARSVQEYIDEG